MSEFTIEYRGYEIEPVRDPFQIGDWQECTVEDAELFRIYPPEVSKPVLDAEAHTLETALRAVDLEIKNV